MTNFFRITENSFFMYFSIVTIYINFISYEYIINNSVLQVTIYIKF
ncbi:hypothetical protein J2736_004439 [Paenibacillus qinlingensis]|uniref:Uncharacterized protein n=1 Tax=Paenibacillus qinlingensis TaxID=1837343 RepID=A0ABU1P1X2_9BACL|nr:hypothetical protein [Paenibacillus qinlingensis]